MIIFVYFDVFKLLLNVQGSLYTSTKAFHKDINLGPVNISTIKAFRMKQFYLPSIIVI